MIQRQPFITNHSDQCPASFWATTTLEGHPNTSFSPVASSIARLLFLRSTPQPPRFSSTNSHINSVFLSCSPSAMPSCTGRCGARWGAGRGAVPERAPAGSLGANTEEHRRGGDFLPLWNKMGRRKIPFLEYLWNQCFVSCFASPSVSGTWFSCVCV